MTLPEKELDHRAMAMLKRVVRATAQLAPRLSADAVATVERWLERLPRPIVLFHSRGNTGQERKSLPNHTAEQFYREFINRCDGTLILLDWDNPVPRLASGRVRHLSDLGSCPTDVMLALMFQANLIVGVDSGPLHAARFTNTPTLGVWMPGYYPSTYSLPRRRGASRGQTLFTVCNLEPPQWRRS